MSEIEQAISDLIEKEFVIYIKRSNDYLRLKQTSGVDIQQKIHDQIESQSGKITTKDVLNGSNFDNYMYPTRYNDDHEMTRFFAFQFISSAEVTVDVDWNLKSESIDADGIIYGIIPENETQLKKITKIIKDTSLGYERYIFVLPKHYKDVEAVAQEYAAIAKLRDHAVDDPVLFDEYEVVFEDLQEIIKGFIGMYTHPENYRSVYIHNGNELHVYRKSGLTEVMSQICDAVYNMTPVINNESVNKNDITSVAQNSRNKIVSALLRSELEPNLGLSGTGQEVSIMRSTLLRTGIWSEDGGVPQINLHPENVNMRHMLETIEDFILETRQNGKTSFAELYERLTLPEYHIGLRYGLIPIYVAAVMHNYRQQIVINDRFGPIQTSADALIQINSDPSSFTLEYLDWNPEKENYIARLSDAFRDYVVDAERSGNSYDYVANAMRRWYMALPKYSKESTKRPTGEKLVRRQLEIMKLLRQNTSSSDLLFKKLPEAVDYHGDYADVATDIIDAKGFFDGLLTELKQELISKTKAAFLPENDKKASKKTTLTDAAKDWCNRLDPKSFEQLFSDGTDRFLQHLRSMTNDEDLFITRLAKLATGLRLEDWDNKTVKQYIVAYFDNRTDVSLTREQRSLFKAFNNVSRLFSVNRCVFFSINLLTSKVNRSQAAHDIHTMIHPVVEADGTICLFCHDDEVMLSFLGFGLRCILSDWYPMADENETLLEKLDIANFSIVRGTDYFSDMIYLLARNYYQSGQPSTYELIPIDFISRAGVDEIDREALNQYVQDQLNAPLYEYGDDYVEYDESAQTQNTDIGADLDLMLLEMDDEDDNPFGEDIEPEDDLDDDDEFFDEDAESENKDEYEFDDIDPEIFRDPLLMVKWLNRHTQNQS